MDKQFGFSAFSGNRLLATGDLTTVLGAAKANREGGDEDSLLLFDNETGKQVDFDLRGSLKEVLLRASPPAPKPGPGRPRLGVRAAEVTLLPRHWDWLEGQPKRASGTLRRLVDSAMRSPSESEERSRRVEAASRFLWSMAGERENFEEVTRCLFAGRWRPMNLLAASWPADIRDHLAWLLCDLPASGDEKGRSWRGRAIEVMATGPRPPATASGKGESWREGATEIIEAIARGRRTATEVMEEHVARIGAVNPKLNALTVLFTEEALGAARLVDESLEAGDPVGPLAGLPFSVKENIDIKGIPTTHGIPAMKGFIPPRDAPLVERLRSAGAIPLAHSNLPDLSLRFHTKSQLYGATLNPRDSSSSPGGSSGGEAVAIATGMSPLGLGNDAGGSVRVPAALSGICSLKPSYGRFPSDRSVGPRDSTLASQLIPVDGLLARRVADLHRVFQIASGPDPRDPRAAPAPLWGPSLPPGFPVALIRNPGGVRSCPEISEALDRAAAQLRAAGHPVEEAEPPRMAEAVEAYGHMIMTEFEASRAMLDRLLGAEGRRYIELATRLRQPVDLAAYLGLTALRQGLQRDWTAFFERWPVALGPVLTELSFPVGYDIAGPAEHERLSLSLCLCQATSFIGLPALALPVGLAGNKPLGIQIISGFWREDLCLEAAALIEAGLGTISPVDPHP